VPGPAVPFCWVAAPPEVGPLARIRSVSTATRDHYLGQMQLARARTILRRWLASPWIDVALAAALTLLGQVELHSLAEGNLGGFAQGFFMLAQTAPVAFRRTHTALAATVGSLALVGEALFAVPTHSLAALLAGLVLVYSVGRHLRGRVLYLVTFLILACLGVHIAALADSGPLDYAFAVLFSGATWGIGRGGQRRYYEAQAEAREAALREVGEQARLASALADERAQIAREMHDVVAHGMGVMVVQAAAAEYLIQQDPQLARQPLATVRQTGQESLAEMRRLLGLLRPAGEPDAGRAPQPTLDQVPGLVARLQAAGMPVSLEMDGPAAAGGAGELPAGLGLCAYRIVQESLTNALKHGGGSPTSVVVSQRDGVVDLRIRNAATGVPGAVASSGGHGIIGMRERAEICDGTLLAAPEPDGGFVVHARLPIPR